MTATGRRAARWPMAALAAIAVLLAACSPAASEGDLNPGTRPAAAGRTTSSTTAANAQPAHWQTATDDVNATGVPGFYTPPAPLPSGAPGTLIRWEQVTGVPGVPSGATVWRILYRSRSIYGADIAESGYVITPAGSAPKGGWPVISWAHGTTGFSRLCAPSIFSAHWIGGVYVIPGLASYLHAGFAIAATDYEGLGAPGVHGYLLGEEEGRAVLDAARAARQLPGTDLSHTVIIYGHSQGGHAALFAGQLAPAYAPDLHVIGVAAAAPATNLSLIMKVVLSPSGGPILIFGLPTAWTWTQTYRDLPVHDLFTTNGARVAGNIVTTGCQNQEASALQSRHLTVQRLFQKNAVNNSVVVAHARLNDPGRVRTQAPILVVQGTADTTVPPALTDMYVRQQACPIGDRIEYLHVTGATHGTVVFEAVQTIVAWMQARLRGDPAPTTCSKPGDVSTISP